MITKGQLTQVYNLLTQAKLDKCEVSERIDVIKVLRKVRPEVEAFQGFINDVQAKNADIISGGDNAKIAQLNGIVANEANKAIENEDIALLTEDAVMHLLESNESWNAAVVMAIEDIFVKN